MLNNEIKCTNCELPVYAKNLCRRHYKKMLAIKNDEYKKEWQKRKNNPEFIIKKREIDRLYRIKKKIGIDTSRKKDDSSLINQDWQSYSRMWKYKNGYFSIKAIKKSSAYHKHRIDILEHYSKDNKIQCNNCECKDIRVLDIDHINNNGAKHRIEMGQLNAVWWIVKNNFPPGFQILCRNCNWIKELEVRNKKFEKYHSL